MSTTAALAHLGKLAAARRPVTANARWCMMDGMEGDKDNLATVSVGVARQVCMPRRSGRPYGKHPGTTCAIAHAAGPFSQLSSSLWDYMQFRARQVFNKLALGGRAL